MFHIDAQLLDITCEKAFGSSHTQDPVCYKLIFMSSYFCQKNEAEQIAWVLSSSHISTSQCTSTTSYEQTTCKQNISPYLVS